MTDYERTKLFLNYLNIGFKEKNDGSQLIIRIKNNGKNKNVIGYNYFYVDYYFDIDSSFTNMGIWE